MNKHTPEDCQKESVVIPHIGIDSYVSPLDKVKGKAEGFFLEFPEVAFSVIVGLGLILIPFVSKALVSLMVGPFLIVKLIRSIYGN